jgi:hypothetical protein
MVADGLIREGLAPSYFIEGMLYNVPPNRFGGTHQQNFFDTLQWIRGADRSTFVCANEQFYLLHESSPMTWRAAQCDAFLAAAARTWDNW